MPTITINGFLKCRTFFSMMDAGAILTAITSMPNLGLSTYCDDTACSQVKNPHDTRRTPGGSSSGEAALISSAGSLLGIGNDIGGSLRIPSLSCGIFAVKPTSYPSRRWCSSLNHSKCRKCRKKRPNLILQIKEKSKLLHEIPLVSPSVPTFRPNPVKF